MYFLASIPRSGSTLLASLLGQRDDTYVSPTSGLSEILGSVVGEFETSLTIKASQKTEKDLFRTMESIIESYYAKHDEPIIFDKSRVWPDPKIMDKMNKILGEPIKIVATVRPIAECIASFYLIDNKSIPVDQWIKTSPLMRHLLTAYSALADGYKQYPDQFCLITYDDLCNQTQRELDRVADFIGISHVVYNPEIQQVDENDNAWNVKDLHRLEPSIVKKEPCAKEVLGDRLFEYYQGDEFWHDEVEPVRPPNKLDLSLEAARRGNTQKSYELLKENERVYPDCKRTKFNLGWHEMARGNLLRGHKLLAMGRDENIFGNNSVLSNRPPWNGEKNCTVMMVMEGGFGDQIHNIRYAREIASYGNDVIVACSPELANLFRGMDGITTICQQDVVGGILHDYWVPAMSVQIPLNTEWSDVTGEPYIDQDGESRGKIGLKWTGNPDFEHQQQRIFSQDLLWDAVASVKDQCISLQKEDDQPDWLEQGNLGTWEDTVREISKCDLVISSCTSIAHLAGAMGKETWVITPILSYYIWAKEGDKCPFYDSVRLFRQTKYDCWSEPFRQLKLALNSRYPAECYDAMGEATKQFIEN